MTSYATAVEELKRAAKELCDAFPNAAYTMRQHVAFGAVGIALDNLTAAETEEPKVEKYDNDGHVLTSAGPPPGWRGWGWCGECERPRLYKERPLPPPPPKEPTYPAVVTGGIPPDPDHRRLFTCCYDRCETTQNDEPLVVTASNGKMATFCRKHYDELAARRLRSMKPETEG